jgi:hypothetical protein
MQVEWHRLSQGLVNESQYACWEASRKRFLFFGQHLSLPTSMVCREGLGVSLPFKTLKLQFTNDENMKLNVKKKITAAQQKMLWDEVVLSIEFDMTSKNVQVLLNKNCTLVVDVNFVASIFKITPTILRGAIRVESVGNGFAAYVDDSIFKRVKILQCRVGGKVSQIDQINVEWQPLLDRIKGQECSYQTRSSAVWGVLLHLLLNVRRKTGRSWCFKRLKHAKELVLIVPVSRNSTTLEVIATIFCSETNEGTKVTCRYFDEVGKSYPAFEVAVDEEGYFDEESSTDDDWRNQLSAPEAGASFCAGPRGPPIHKFSNTGPSEWIFLN